MAGGFASLHGLARLNASDLITFEENVARFFAAKEIKGPIHLSGGNENELIEIFKDIGRADWVFSTYRNHYHALLHGIDPDWLWAEIKAGRSMNISSPAHHFFTSAIVGGCLPIAVGAAAACKRFGTKQKVWCFLGDMAGMTGAAYEAYNYSRGHDLPITFVVEDNGMSCDTPTLETWGFDEVRPLKGVRYYKYTRSYPHSGIGSYVF